MRAAIYTRVTTGMTARMQTRELREYSERRGWQIAGDYAAAIPDQG